MTVVALTNGSRESTEKLLARGKLAEYVHEIFSCDDVRRFNPHPAPYELVRTRLGGTPTLVAAHGWDVVGARSAGLKTIWVEREEREWPFPLEPPARARDLSEAAGLLLSG